MDQTIKFCYMFVDICIDNWTTIEQKVLNGKNEQMIILHLKFLSILPQVETNTFASQAIYAASLLCYIIIFFNFPPRNTEHRKWRHKFNIPSILSWILILIFSSFLLFLFFEINVEMLWHMIHTLAFPYQNIVFLMLYLLLWNHCWHKTFV